MIGSEFAIGELKSLVLSLERLAENMEWEEKEREATTKELGRRRKEATDVKASDIMSSRAYPVGFGVVLPGGRENWEFLARKSDNLFKAVLDKSAERSL